MCSVGAIAARLDARSDLRGVVSFHLFLPWSRLLSGATLASRAEGRDGRNPGE